MPKTIKIEKHLTICELEQRYRQAKLGTEKIHYQVIWLLAGGKTTLYVSEVTGYSRNWIYCLVRRYNREGIQGLKDQRSNNEGRPSLIDDIEQGYLWQVLQDPAPDGGLWNSRKVANWLSEKIGKPVSPQRGWDYLRQMDLRLKQPRREHLDCDLLEQQQWKKN